ncbi:MAG TPA: hypothetical protein PLT82_02255 [Candidatus Hydrogenedens sp.]|nr:hypothetical protein [Candidatus Hydrogenedens sp.]
MKKNNKIWVFFLFVCLITPILFSCSKPAPKEPLKETQIYGNPDQLISRSLLTFQPQADTFALISPSVTQIIHILSKINSFAENKVLNDIINQPIISMLLKGKEDQSFETSLKSIGINIDNPCAFFYTPNDKWQIVLPTNNLDAFAKVFPDAKKTSLKTSWYWFISAPYSAYWDNKNKFGFMLYRNHIVCSNDLSLLTQTILRENILPSYNYGLYGKPILGTNEIAILLSISDELKKKVSEDSYEPNWFKAVTLTLGRDYDEFCAVINPNSDFTEIAFSVHSLPNMVNKSKKPELTLSKFLPDNSLLTLDLALTNAIREFLPNLLRQDTKGDLKTKFNKLTGIVTSPLISDELSIGIYPSSELYPDIVFFAKSKQVENAKGLLKAVAVDDEPIGDFSTLKADLSVMLKLPLTLNIGFKDPYIVLTNNRTKLISLADKVALDVIKPEESGESESLENSDQSEKQTQSNTHNECPYGFLKIDTNNIKLFLEANKNLLESNNLEPLTQILPNIPEICLYEKDSWYLMKAKITM